MSIIGADQPKSLKLMSRAYKRRMYRLNTRKQQREMKKMLKNSSSGYVSGSSHSDKEEDESTLKTPSPSVSKDAQTDVSKIQEDDCIVVEPLKDTVIYIDCDEIDETLVKPPDKNDKNDNIHRNDTTEHFLTHNNTTLEDGEIRSDDDVTIVREEIEQILKFVQDSADTFKPSTSKKMTPRKKKSNARAPKSTATTSKQIDLAISPERIPNKLFVVDTIGGASPISSIPMYNYDKMDKNDSCYTINDTFDLTGIEENNESVIFCGEYMNTEKAISKRTRNDGGDFISIFDPNEVVPAKKNKKNKSKNNPNISRIESSTGKNFYNPNKKVLKKNEKRMIIIDGSNVAYQHSNNRFFSAEGLETAIKFFEKIGHETKAIVPQYRMQLNQTSNQTLITRLHKEGKIILTPSKRLPGKSCTSYDDRFILQCAKEFDAAVISNDNYRDLVQDPDFKYIVENRVIGYTWFKDMFIVPQDPYGSAGPSLSDILSKKE